ncbi:MAG: exonuclease SbcCD subunit D [Marinilabiliaceae bacterium]
MKLLHTSDWHIGQQFFGYGRLDEHRHFLSQLADIVEQEKPDLMVVSGDIFHTSTPSADAQKVFVDGLLGVCGRNPAMRTIVTAGNHDSANRMEADKALWTDKNVSIVGVFPRDEKNNIAPEMFVREIPGVAIVAAVPYVSPRFTDYREMFGRIESEVARLNADGLPVVYMAHTSVDMGNGKPGEYGDDGVGGIDYVQLDDFGTGYDYLALGHIHKPVTIEGSEKRARYCGSPIAVSFDEEQYRHGVDIVELARGASPTIRAIGIEQARGMRTLPAHDVFAPLDEVIAMFEKMDGRSQDYVRLNVEVENYLPVDAQERAERIAAEKECRLCQIYSRQKNKVSDTGAKAMTISEFRELSPMDIAKKEYSRVFGADMPADIAQKLDDVIKTVEAEG